MSNVIAITKTNYGRGYTCAAAVIQELAHRLQELDDRNCEEIARQIGCTGQTIRNLMNMRTRWPRPDTLFGVIGYLHLTLMLVPEQNVRRA